MPAVRLSATLAPVTLATLCLVMGLSLVALPASASAAEGLAPGAAIRAAIAGNTLRGSLDASGTFEEFYAEDGAIRGPDYRGEWSIRGDSLCLAHDGNPAGCWGLRLDGRQVIWVGAGGDEGSATILPGNPNGY